MVRRKVAYNMCVANANKKGLGMWTMEVYDDLRFNNLSFETVGNRRIKCDDFLSRLTLRTTVCETETFVYFNEIKHFIYVSTRFVTNKNMIQQNI